MAESVEKNDRHIDRCRISHCRRRFGQLSFILLTGRVKLAYTCRCKRDME